MFVLKNSFFSLKFMFFHYLRVCHWSVQNIYSRLVVINQQMAAKATMCGRKFTRDYQKIAPLRDLLETAMTPATSMTEPSPSPSA